MPNRFKRLNSASSMVNQIDQINQNFAQLDNESVVKIFKNGDDNAIIFGRYADGRYGLLISDDAGVPRILIGQASDDGRPGSWISKEGENVLTLLGG